MAQAAFKYYADLIELRELFYSENDDSLLERAVSLVSFWLARENVPHGVNSTSLFIATKLQDFQLTNLGLGIGIGAGSGSESMLRASYSMAFVRFVNGLLDPFQQGTHATALVEIAKKISLPYEFVEIRHSATHNALPSLELLRDMTDSALRWLWDRYWLQIEPQTSAERTSECALVSKLYLPSSRHIHALLRDYRRQVKEGKIQVDLDALIAVAENPDTSYKMCILLLRHCEKIGAYEVSRQLYSPFINSAPSSFLYQLIVSLISYESEKDLFVGACELAELILRRIASGLFPFRYYLEFNSQEDVLASLKAHQNLLKPTSKLARALLGRKTFTRPALLDDILLDRVPETNEERIPNKRSCISFLEFHETWTPTPFGIVPN